MRHMRQKISHQLWGAAPYKSMREFDIMQTHVWLNGLPAYISASDIDVMQAMLADGPSVPLNSRK